MERRDDEHPRPEGSGEGETLSEVIASYLEAVDAGKNPEDVDYIVAHGTGTPLNDASETVSIKRAFGESAYQVAISSPKSMVGHLLGAAGAISGAAAVLAIRDGLIPPTVNLDTPDPECDLDYVPNKAREAPVRVAMANGFGFGGQNGSIVFRGAAKKVGIRSIHGGEVRVTLRVGNQCAQSMTLLRAKRKALVFP